MLPKRVQGQNMDPPWRLGGSKLRVSARSRYKAVSNLSSKVEYAKLEPSRDMG